MVVIKVIFLDIDGVLNYNCCPYKVSGLYFVDPEKILLLKQIIDKTGAKVVLSSTWRYGRQLGDEAPMEYSLFKRLKRKLAEYGVFFYSYTPILQYDGRAHRGTEIQQWIENWRGDKVESFIILDDDTDMEPYMCRLVHTEWNSGLTEDDVEKAVELLVTVDL